MKQEYISAFTKSILELFESMLDCTVMISEATPSKAEEENPDIIGLIGLSGTARGILALKFPVKTALAVVGKLIGQELQTIGPAVIDGVGELVNIVAGSAKREFEKHSISLSLPTVVRGNIYRLQNLSDLEWLTASFESELGNFSMEVSFKTITTGKKEVEDASVSC